MIMIMIMIMIRVNVIIQNRQTTQTPPESTVISFDCETNCPMSMDLTGYCKLYPLFADGMQLCLALPISNFCVRVIIDWSCVDTETMYAVTTRWVCVR